MKSAILAAVMALAFVAAPAVWAADKEPFTCYIGEDDCTGSGKPGIKKLKQCQDIISNDPQAFDGGSWMDNHGVCHTIESDGSVG